MQDPQIGFEDVQLRRTLEKENNLYKTALDHEMDDLKEQAKTVGKYALIGGAALIGSYFLFKYLNKPKQEETLAAEPEKSLLGTRTQVVVEKPVIVKDNPVISMLKEQLALLFISVVREKLAEFTGVEKKKLEQKKNELT